jgi:hypothetical protein
MTNTARTSAHLLTYTISHRAGAASIASPLGAATTVFACVEMRAVGDAHSADPLSLVLDAVGIAQAMLAHAAADLRA